MYPYQRPVHLGCITELPCYYSGPGSVNQHATWTIQKPLMSSFGLWPEEGQATSKVRHVNLLPRLL